MFQYNLYPILLLSIVADKTLFTLRPYLLLSSPTDASVDIIDGEGSFDFCFKAEFTSTLHVAADTERASPRFTQITLDSQSNWNS